MKDTNYEPSLFTGRLREKKELDDSFLLRNQLRS